MDATKMAGPASFGFIAVSEAGQTAGVDVFELSWLVAACCRYVDL